MLFLIFSVLSSTSLGHMSMQFPYPRDKLNGRAYAKWEQNEPMISVHPTICHGLDKDATVRTGNAFKAGQSIKIDIYGGAPHSGGHCAFWISTDDVNFIKIIDKIDCTIKETSVILPPSLPSECQTKCTFAFTWVPRESGACEIYMNCADISVSGVNGGQPSTVSLNFNTQFINAANYGCIRVDNNSHKTTIFSTIKETYDTGVEGNNEEVVGTTVGSTDVCFENTAKAINLNNQVANNGICGSGADDYRCDDGQCCSAGGYCGPDYDGQGYVNYDTTPQSYYSSKEAAFSAYCTNSQGDWRVVECPITNLPGGSSGVNMDDSDNNNNDDIEMNYIE